MESGGVRHWTWLTIYLYRHNGSLRARRTQPKDEDVVSVALNWSRNKRGVGGCAGAEAGRVQCNRSFLEKWRIAKALPTTQKFNVQSLSLLTTFQTGHYFMTLVEKKIWGKTAICYQWKEKQWQYCIRVRGLLYYFIFAEEMLWRHSAFVQCKFTFWQTILYFICLVSCVWKSGHIKMTLKDRITNFVRNCFYQSALHLIGKFYLHKIQICIPSKSFKYFSYSLISRVIFW